VTTTSIPQIETYLEQFTEFQQVNLGQRLPWLRRLREDAFARFSETGFPTTHDEDWRFTNVTSIARTPFVLPQPSPTQISRADLQSWRIKEAEVELVFIDGRFAPEFSEFNSSHPSVFASGLAKMLVEQPEQIEAHLGRYLDIRRDPFCALNTAFTADGAYVRVGRGAVIDAPIHLLFISTSRYAVAMVHPRNLVVVEEQGQATVIEEYLSLGRGTMLCNSVTELIAGESTTVSHYMIEREHREAFNISTLRIQQNRNANVASHSLLLGGGLVRNNVHPVLAGEGGECLINGLFIGDGRQHLDNYMHVEHAGPHSSSRQFYNGILDGHAHGVFHGRIVVHKAAQKTDAKQTNRNLLLSDDAQIDTKPQLEIYADDVKCTHGATIGQIDADALFYLQSRGIDENPARKILLLAFAGECVERMRPGAARDHAERLVHAHLLSVGIARASHDDRSHNELEIAQNWEEVG